MPDVAPDPISEDDKSRLYRITEEIHQKLGDHTVSHRFGRKYLDEHAQRRRIVWVPAGGDIQPPKQAGAGTVAGHKIVMCCARAQRVEAHVFAESSGLLEDLHDALLAAIHLAVNEPKFPGGYSDETEKEGEAGHTNRTEKIVLSVAIRFPVPVEIKPLRAVTGVDHVCGTLQEDGTTLPEPTE